MEKRRTPSGLVRAVWEPAAALRLGACRRASVPEHMMGSPITATRSNCAPAPFAAAPARLRRSYCVPAKLAFSMTLAQRTVSDFT
jgi:hypothetical protein